MSISDGSSGPEDRSQDSVSPVEAEARVGTVVDGKYALVRLLGRGGMGAVYEARHTKLARRFAIKFLLPEAAKNREILRRFENEAKAAGGLEHPNLAAVTDFGRGVDGAPYIVMEFLQGEDCSKLIARLGPLPIARAAGIVVQACHGLVVAHDRGIIHRDLKPENLFVTDAGNGSDLVKVLDFGIAKLRLPEGSTVTSTGVTFGTAHYMSPEQARGAGDVDHRTDVWSLGVVLYELLAGRKPFVGDQFLNVIYQILSVDAPPLASIRPDLPPQLVALVERAMSRDLDSRVSSVADLARQLDSFGGSATKGSGHSLAPTLPLSATRAFEPDSAEQTGAGLEVSSGFGQTDRLPTSRPVGKFAIAASLAVAVVGVVALLAQPGRPHPTVQPPPPVPALAPPSLPLAKPSSTPSPARPPFAPNPVTPSAVNTPAPATTKSEQSADSPNRRSEPPQPKRRDHRPRAPGSSPVQQPTTGPGNSPPAMPLKSQDPNCAIPYRIDPANGMKIFKVECLDE